MFATHLPDVTILAPQYTEETDTAFITHHATGEMEYRPKTAPAGLFMPNELARLAIYMAARSTTTPANA